MALRRHECRACGAKFRVLESPGDENHVVCPSCGSRDTQRLLPRVAVQFKGSGFYKTDRAKRTSGSSEERATEKKEPIAAPASSDD
ncbi:MAG: FmdB family zinc ribbon protein [Candidatus Bipolaricaulota bacterium]